MTDQTGYIYGSLKDQSLSISPQYYTAASGNQAVSVASTALRELASFLLCTKRKQGTVYFDGISFPDF
jgi:hypothetical protein